MNLSVIISWIVFTVISLCCVQLAGIGTSGFFKLKLRNYEYMSVGFVVMIGLIELFGWFFVAFQLPLVGFEIVTAGVVFLLLFLGVKYMKEENRKKKREKQKLSIGQLAAIGITILLIVLVMLYYRADADDSFYVSNVALFKVSEILNPYDSSFGIESLGTVPMYDFQVWEAFMAVLCRVFHLEASVMTHTVCLPVLLILSASAFMFLGRILFENSDKKAAWFYTGITIFHLFGGYAVYSEGSFLLSRLWQGKAVYLNIVIPVMAALILKNIRKKNNTLMLQILLCVLAGIALNPTSMYVMGFLLLFMMIAVCIIERSGRKMLQVIPSMVPIVFFTVLIYLRAHQFEGQIEAASSTSKDFVLQEFLKFMGEGKWYLIVFLISLLLIWKLGNKEVKLYLVGTPLLLLVTIWNPWLGRLVAENVTMTPSYWRVFWLLPIGPAIVTAGILLAGKIDSGKFVVRSLIVIGTILALALPGKWMFTEENRFVKADNLQRIPEEVLFFGEEITKQEKKSIVLADDTFSTTMRQQYVDLELIYSREQYVLDLFRYRGEEEQATERLYMMNVMTGRTDDLSKMTALLQKYKVDYVIVNIMNGKLQEYLQMNNWKNIAECNMYILYQQ